MTDWWQIPPRTRKGTPHRIWAVAEVDRLLQMWRERAPVNEIARALGRTPVAIRVRVCVLGLEKRGHVTAPPPDLSYDDDLRAGRRRDGAPSRDMTPIEGDMTAALMRDPGS